MASRPPPPRRSAPSLPKVEVPAIVLQLIESATTPGSDVEENVDNFMNYLESTDEDTCRRALMLEHQRLPGALAKIFSKTSSAELHKKCIQSLLVVATLLPLSLSNVDRNFPVAVMGCFWGSTNETLQMMCLYLLAELCSAENLDLAFLKEQQTVHALFDLLGEDKEDLCVAIVILLMYIHQLSAREGAVVLLVASQHQNRQFFAECVVRLINRSDDRRQLQVALSFVSDCLTSLSQPLFYTSDLQMLIDVILRQIQSIKDVSDSDTHQAMRMDCREAMFQALKTIVLHSNFTTHKHRRADILAIANETAENSTPPPNVRRAAVELLTDCIMFLD